LVLDGGLAALTVKIVTFFYTRWGTPKEICDLDRRVGGVNMLERMVEK
jgi:hypothetical protein